LAKGEIIKRKCNNILCLVGGMSGGHVLPALRLAEKWIKVNPGGSVCIFTAGWSKGSKIEEQQSKICVNFKILKIDRFSSKSISSFFKFGFQISVAFLKSFCFFFKLKPIKIISVGGIVSLPVCFAAKLQWREIDLYEPNAVPGRAARVLATISNRVLITFNCCANNFGFLGFRVKKKCSLVEYPLRFKINDLACDKKIVVPKINSGIKSGGLFLSATKKTIFVFGGSQGSFFLNDVFTGFISRNASIKKEIQVIHQIGASDKRDWCEFYGKHQVAAFVFDYSRNIKDFYGLSDLVVCRAGAGALFELLFFKKQSIIIPLVCSTTSHQLDNAEEMAKLHPLLFTVLLQKDASDPAVLDRCIFEKLGLENKISSSKSQEFCL
jgi:UDP-N-acetylglucosamine--N-acetylmuramyl-(pentapeptide) pyrophosphoryl-undecaprenol N-acetylglucosamine transferase